LQKLSILGFTYSSLIPRNENQSNGIVGRGSAIENFRYGFSRNELEYRFEIYSVTANGSISEVQISNLHV